MSLCPGREPLRPSGAEPRPAAPRKGRGGPSWALRRARTPRAPSSPVASAAAWLPAPHDGGGAAAHDCAIECSSAWPQHATGQRGAQPDHVQRAHPCVRDGGRHGRGVPGALCPRPCGTVPPPSPLRPLWSRPPVPPPSTLAPCAAPSPAYDRNTRTVRSLCLCA